MDKNFKLKSSKKTNGEKDTDEYLNELINRIGGDCELCPAFDDCDEARCLNCEFDCDQMLRIALNQDDNHYKEKTNKEIFVKILKAKYPDTTADVSLPPKELAYHMVDIHCQECPMDSYCLQLKKSSPNQRWDCRLIAQKWLNEDDKLVFDLDQQLSADTNTTGHQLINNLEELLEYEDLGEYAEDIRLVVEFLQKLSQKK